MPETRERLSRPGFPTAGIGAHLGGLGPPHDGVPRPERVDLRERGLDLGSVAGGDARHVVVEAEQGDEAGVATRGVEHLECRREVEGAQLVEVGAQRRAGEGASSPGRFHPCGG